jgi:hypothetical protein
MHWTYLDCRHISTVHHDSNHWRWRWQRRWSVYMSEMWVNGERQWCSSDDNIGRREWCVIWMISIYIYVMIMNEWYAWHCYKCMRFKYVLIRSLSITVFTQSNTWRCLAAPVSAAVLCSWKGEPSSHMEQLSESRRFAGWPCTTAEWWNQWSLGTLRSSCNYHDIYPLYSKLVEGPFHAAELWLWLEWGHSWVPYSRSLSSRRKWWSPWWGKVLPGPIWEQCKHLERVG